MSRVKIGAVVALVVALLTVAAYLITARRLETRIQADLEARVGKAQALLTQIGALEALDLAARAEAFARDDGLARALDQAEPAARNAAGGDAIKRFLAGLAKGSPRPDFVAAVDGKGQVVIMDAPLPQPEDWRGRFKAVAAALDDGQVSKDIWSYGKDVMKVGVAPVLGEGGRPKGAVVIAYALSAQEAAVEAQLLGTEVAYFHDERVRATSFHEGIGQELERDPTLKELTRDALAGRHRVGRVEVDGETYLAAAAPLPLSFDDRTSGALVLASLKDALAPVFIVKLAIVLFGLAALVLCLLTMVLTTRVTLHPVDDIELGVNEVINGNVDYVFQRAGADFDGLANSLNVMLARLLGRPEPGEDIVDENGNPVTPGKVILDDELSQGALAGARSASESAVMLAQEPETDYYRRIYREYLDARRAVGDKVDSVSFEGFTAKLRLTEASLKKRYSCKAVRFRVQAKDNQVILKPVPIL